MLSKHIQASIDAIHSNRAQVSVANENSPCIGVNALASKAGVLYEKLRYMVDRKDENTIRRSAIERILKRKILIEQETSAGFALLQELVTGGYLPNDAVPETAADYIQTVVDKYLLFFKNCEGFKKTEAISLMASELESYTFSHSLEDELAVDSFYNTVRKKVKYSGDYKSDDADIQTYIACRRRLIMDDKESLLYAVLLKYLPQLSSNMTESEVSAMSQDFILAYKKAKKSLRSKSNLRAATKLRDYGVYFAVIQELMHKYGADVDAVLNNDEKLDEEIRTLISDRHAQQYAHANKSGMRAVVYILLTKTILALLIELPYDIFILQSIQYVALATNILFHPLLLLVIVKTIRSPSEADGTAIVAGVKNIILENPEIQEIHIKPRITSMALLASFVIFYWLLFVATFGLILAVLGMMDFSVVSAALFVFFLTLVTYFAFRIRYIAEKWKVKSSDTIML